MMPGQYNQGQMTNQYNQMIPPVHQQMYNPLMQQPQNQQMYNPQMQQPQNQQMYNPQMQQPRQMYNAQMQQQMQQQIQQQQQMLQAMVNDNSHTQPIQMQGTLPANNQLLQQFQNMQQAGYHAQVQQVIGQNNILSNPMIINNRERLLTQMQNEQENEAIRRAQQKVNNKEMTQTDLMRVLTLHQVQLPKKGPGLDDQETRVRNKDVHMQYDFVNSSWDNEADKYKQSRTNQPYKIIINREENKEDPKRMLEKERHWLATKDDSYRPSWKDLVVHTITDADKEGVREEHERENYIRKELDDENRITYSDKNKTQHLKKFEFKHIYKYRIRIDSKNHVELKDDQVAYYENEQRKLEEGRVQSDALLSELQKNDMIDRDMLESGLEKPIEDVTNTEVDALMERLGLGARKSSKKDRLKQEFNIPEKSPNIQPTSRFIKQTINTQEPIQRKSPNIDDSGTITFKSRRKVA
jgi:type II secretory pathway pseudopilin PulG